MERGATMSCVYGAQEQSTAFFVAVGRGTTAATTRTSAVADCDARTPARSRNTSSKMATFLVLHRYVVPRRSPRIGIMPRAKLRAMLTFISVLDLARRPGSTEVQVWYTTRARRRSNKSPTLSSRRRPPLETTLAGDHLPGNETQNRPPTEAFPQKATQGHIHTPRTSPSLEEDLSFFLGQTLGQTRPRCMPLCDDGRAG